MRDTRTCPASRGREVRGRPRGLQSALFASMVVSGESPPIIPLGRPRVYLFTNWACRGPAASRPLSGDSRVSRSVVLNGSSGREFGVSVGRRLVGVDVLVCPSVLGRGGSWPVWVRPVAVTARVG